MDKDRLIDRAVEELKTNPFDAVHDLRHHKLVWRNCLDIIRNEGLKSVDMDALEVAVMWHDVQRGQEDEFALLRETLIRLDTPSDETEKVLGIAGNHSYGSEQEAVEAKILFDADKLEYVNCDRVEILLKEYKRGKISNDRLVYYVRIWNERIRFVRDKMHFDYSKKVFEERLKTFEKYAFSHQELKGFVMI